MEANRLRQALEVWTLDPRDATHRLEELRGQVIELCDLNPRQIQALPDDTISLLTDLKDHVKDFMEESS